jgi:hypothetical protein
MHFLISTKEGLPIRLVTDESDVLNPGETRAPIADSDLETLRVQVAKNQRNAEIRQARMERFRNESDPLFLKAQRGKATQEDWLNKIAEIEADLPYEI